ncbi:MAG TPA: hypothetical protein DEB31_04160 [Clostridiales bacterium]|nr:hypothetical protein [Clostridiales bacterium]
MNKLHGKWTRFILISALCAFLLLSCSRTPENIYIPAETNVSTGSGKTISPQAQPQQTPSPQSEVQATGTPAATPTETPPQQTPAATPTQSAPPETNLPMLRLEGNFMPVKSIGDIDVAHDKVVALTFDDGPDPARTDQLLRVLADNDVVATFFVLGQNVERYPEVLGRINDAGHEIGTHSYNHTDLMRLSYDRIMTEQYNKTNDIIEQIIGARALIDRPPYGSMSTEMAEQIGRVQVMWSVDPQEWRAENKNTESLYQNVINGSAQTGQGVQDGSVVLSHDIHQVTADTYDRIIKELKDRGFKFVTVTQMMQIAEQRGKTEGFYKFNGAPSVEQAAENPAENGAAA